MKVGAQALWRPIDLGLCDHCVLSPLCFWFLAMTTAAAVRLRAVYGMDRSLVARAAEITPKTASLSYWTTDPAASLQSPMPASPWRASLQERSADAGAAGAFAGHGRSDTTLTASLHQRNASFVKVVTSAIPARHGHSHSRLPSVSGTYVCGPRRGDNGDGMAQPPLSSLHSVTSGRSFAPHSPTPTPSGSFPGQFVPQDSPERFRDGSVPYSASLPSPAAATEGSKRSLKGLPKPANALPQQPGSARSTPQPQDKQQQQQEFWLSLRIRYREHLWLSFPERQALFSTVRRDTRSEDVTRFPEVRTSATRNCSYGSDIFLMRTVGLAFPCFVCFSPIAGVYPQ